MRPLAMILAVLLALAIWKLVSMVLQEIGAILDQDEQTDIPGHDFDKTDDENQIPW